VVSPGGTLDSPWSYRLQQHINQHTAAICNQNSPHQTQIYAGPRAADGPASSGMAPRMQQVQSAGGQASQCSDLYTGQATTEVPQLSL